MSAAPCCEPAPGASHGGVGPGSGAFKYYRIVLSETSQTLPYAGRFAAPPAISCPGSSPSVRSAFSFWTSS